MGLSTFVLVAVGALVLASWLLGPWALIVVLGGVLAYLGDTVAGYFGKKRLSLWGMRPKHTAIVVSIATGVIITMITLVAAALISQEYRVALTGVRKLQADSEKLRSDSEKLRSDNADLKERSLALLREYEDRARQVQAQAKVIHEKETGDVAVPKDAPLLSRPVLVDPAIEPSQLASVVTTMIEQIKANVTDPQLGVTFQTPDPREVDEKLVKGIYSRTQEIARFEKAHPEERVTQCFIRPISLKNVNKHEKLSLVNFEVQPNSVVVPRGTTIAHTTVDGHQPDDVILSQLFNFDTHVQDILRERHVLPESLANRLGRVPAAVLLDFVHVMESIRGYQLTVRAVAREDIRALGLISISYMLSEDPTASRRPGARVGGSSRATPPESGPTQEAAGDGGRRD